MLLFCSSRQLIKIQSNLLFIKRSLIFFNNKIVFNGNSIERKLCFNNNKNYLVVSRLYCDKKLQTISEEKRKQQKQLEIGYESIPKRNKFFELILKKPNELIDWYKRTPAERRRSYYYSFLIKYVLYSLGFVLIFSSGFMLLYAEDNPITGRKCVYSLPKGLLDEIEGDTLTELLQKYEKSDSFVPSTSNYVKRLDRVVDKIINSNKDIEGLGELVWTPVVIDDDNRCDVIVLKESGHIIVFKKMIDLCETDDQLAYVLAHQLSHLLLDHRREPTAYISIFAIPFVLILPKVWIIGKPDELMPKFDWMQIFDDYFNTKIKNWIRGMLQYSPYTEELEEEADRIALQLITRCCLDVRESRNFCNKNKLLSISNDSDSDNRDNSNFFLKHPINNNKLRYLNSYMNAFIKLRNECNCDPLV